MTVRRLVVLTVMAITLGSVGACSGVVVFGRR